MTKKRKRSIDETFSEKLNTCLQQSMKKSKLHPEYHEVYSKHTVPVLREMVRNTRNKKWHSLRKPNLVSIFIVHKCASTISKYFKRIVQKHRDSIIESRMNDGSKCPITLDLVSEINNKFVHNGIVFSRHELIKYMMFSEDFCNPVTRKMMGFADIQRMCSHCFLGPPLLEKYNNRV